MSPRPRKHSERIAAARERLHEEFQLWLSTSGAKGPHLIPLAFVDDGNGILIATGEHSVTTRNLKANRRARFAVGTTTDVLMVDAVLGRVISVEEIEPSLADRYAAVSHDPRTFPGYSYLRLLPQRVQVWNGFHEFAGRTVMLNGEWLDTPVT